MSMKTNLWMTLILAALPAVAPIPAASSDRVEQLIDRIVGNEQELMQQLREFNPVLETYLQEVERGADPASEQASDHYLIGKLTVGEGVSHSGFLASPAFRKNGAVVFFPDGFAQMVIMDAYDFNRETYGFEYVRREFLGEVRTLVFNVGPKEEKTVGKFIGRIWVEDRDYRIVRFNGTYTFSKASSLFFHFDSWRLNVAPGVWMPAFVYIEDANLSGKGETKVRFRGQTRIWGYQTPRSGKLQELTDILIEADNPVDDRSESKHITPVESQRFWQRQAETNVLDRLESSGLLAPKGGVDDVLNTVVNNLIVTNDISLDVHCRVLLTTPLETFSIGQAIVISRGLLDVLPDEASLAMVISDELAHIALGHQTETRYAFSDQTMFEDEEILNQLRLSRPEEEIEAAGEKALEILKNSPYVDKLANAGLFLKALANRSPYLPNLIEANLGNKLANGDTLLRLSDLASQAPELKEHEIEQIAALPLGSRVELNPWNNEIRLIETKPVALLSARDKMPFEVSPFVIHLTRFKPADRTTPPTKEQKTTPPETQTTENR